MGLLDKTLSLAKKASGTVIDSANKKIDAAKQKKLEAEQKFIREFPYTNRYIVRQKESVSVDLVLWDVLEKDSYVIYNANEEPVYIAKGTMFMGKHHFVVTNSQNERVGKVSKALFKVPVPFVKDRKGFTVDIDGVKPFDVETSVSFGERDFSISNNLNIQTNEKEKEFKVFDKNNKKPIIHIYKVRSDERFYWDKYVVGFDDEKNKMLAFCMAIGIDAILFAPD